MKRSTPASLHLFNLVSLLVLSMLVVGQVAFLPTPALAEQPDQKKPLPVIAVPPATDTSVASTSILPQTTSTPALRIKTSGAVGVPASFSLPSGLQTMASPAAPSLNDWSADLREGFEANLDAWQVLTLSDDSAAEGWRRDDAAAHSGAQSLWVAAGDTKDVDPAVASAPPVLDTWLVSSSYVDLSTARMADVQFYMTTDIAPEVDRIFVGASVDGMNFVGEYWTGDSGGWQAYTFDLADFIGQPQVYLAWYFHSADMPASDAGYTGVRVDDIAVWTYTNTEPARIAEETHNGSFETGDLTGWAMPVTSTVMPLEAPNPNGGRYVAYFGGIANAQETLYQSVAVPDGPVTRVSLRFWVNQFGQETTAGADRFCASIRNAALSATLLDLGCLDGSAVISATFAPDGWTQVDYPLLGDRWNLIKGQTVNIVFEMLTNDRQHTVLFLDDVTLEIVTGGTSGDVLEPDNTTAEATVARMGEAVADLTIDPTNDQDTFSLVGQAGDTVTVDIDAAVNGSTLDAVVRLLQPDGTQVCRNDDDGASLDAYLVCTLPTSGSYYVAVTSYDGRGSRTAFYDITISIGPGNNAPVASTPEPPTNPTRPWTVMLYLNGDNNLCNSYPGLISRMEQELGAKIGANGFLNIAVLFDRHPSYCSDQDGSTTRMLIQPGGEYQENVNRWNMGELNMGDPQTLINFATWAMRNYPAEHYYLAIDNHGNGMAGISWDYTNARDRITIPELHSALKQMTNNGQRKLDVFAYEACLMGLYENAYDIRQFVDYIFVFETVSWTSSASYPSYLGDPRFTAATTGQELGKILFEVYFATVTAPYAVSLIDASQMEAVRAAVDSWSDALGALLATSGESITLARQAAQKIDTDLNDRLDDNDQYIDLWHLADTMAAQGIAVPQSDAVKAAVEAAVLYNNAHSSDRLNYANTNGLSIYWPRFASGSYTAYTNEQLYATTRDGTWDEFLQAYRESEERPGLPTDGGAADRQPVEKWNPLVTQRLLYLPLVTR